MSDSEAVRTALRETAARRRSRSAIAADLPTRFSRSASSAMRLRLSSRRRGLGGRDRSSPSRRLAMTRSFTSARRVCAAC
jgi:hypothetical protein